MGKRRDTRQRYSIEGSGGSDLYVLFALSNYLLKLICLRSLCTWCCVPCALTQESREIELEEESLRGHQLKA